MLDLSLLLPGTHCVDAVPGNAGRLSVDEYFPHIKNVGAERIPFTLFMDATGCGDSLCNRLGLTRGQVNAECIQDRLAVVFLQTPELLVVHESSRSFSALFCGS